MEDEFSSGVTVGYTLQWSQSGVPQWSHSGVHTETAEKQARPQPDPTWAGEGPFLLYLISMSVYCTFQYSITGILFYYSRV